jgi:hypothetical protein
MNNKHLYCTVAVGEYYLNSAINMAKKLNEISDTHHFLITTNIQTEAIDNTTINIIPEDKTLFIGECFNYMLKYYPLYVSSDMGYENIIFIDADWRILDTYNQDNIKNVINFMDSNGFDVLFERPYPIGNAKTDRECIFFHKINFYNLLETSEYDSGHMCNEQFLIFKNNDKFKIFINKFKELYEISTSANLWPFAEGLELGMSMVTADMKFTWSDWDYYLKNMYEFSTRDGGILMKF